MFTFAYRYPKQGTLTLPVRVRSSGFYRVWKDWHDLVRVKYFLELFWCISGKVQLAQKDSAPVILEKDRCCCYFPGDLHRVSSLTPAEFCWITFDGDQCMDLIKNFSLTREPWTAGPCPQDLFAGVRMKLHNPGIEGELQAGVLGYDVLSRAKLPPAPENTSLVGRFVNEVKKNFDDPELSIDSIAETLGIHRSTLIRNVFSVCNVTPQQYLIDYRMQQAMTLLMQPDLSIKELAERAGFSSANYFGKVFFRRYGKTPSEMRKTS